MKYRSKTARPLFCKKNAPAPTKARTAGQERNDVPTRTFDALPCRRHCGRRLILAVLCPLLLAVGGCGLLELGKKPKPAACTVTADPPPEDAGVTSINRASTPPQPAPQPPKPATPPATDKPPAAAVTPAKPGATVTPVKPGAGTPQATTAAKGAPKGADPGNALAETSEASVTTQVRLNIQHLDIGIPLDFFGENLAVVPAGDGHKCVGLNGVNFSRAFFTGKDFKNFTLEAKVDYAFPIAEGRTVNAELLSLLLGATIRRTLSVTITQQLAEPPMAVFSLGAGQYASQMQCSPRPVRWKEDIPGFITNLTVTKNGGSLDFAYNGETVCTAPVSPPSLTLNEFSATLENQARIYDMVLTKNGDSDIPGVPSATGPATEAAQEQPFPVAETAHADGETRFNLSKLPTGAPIGGFGRNLIVMQDEEGKYVASTAKDGTYVLLPADPAKNFSASFLVKNAFTRSDRSGDTSQFFLFTLNYKNGISEMFTLNLTRPDGTNWQSRYFISRSGPPDVMSWTDSTDYRAWDNALDFNEYKVIKEKNLIRFFFNGEFIRSQKTLGDAFASIRVNLRPGERLYDVIVRDLNLCAPPPKGKAANTRPRDAGHGKSGS